jgi:hypothetical protein
MEQDHCKASSTQRTHSTQLKPLQCHSSAAWLVVVYLAGQQAVPASERLAWGSRNTGSDRWHLCSIIFSQQSSTAQELAQ